MGRGTLKVLGGERAERSPWGRDTPEVEVPVIGVRHP